ncbi:MAG: hypothetical protein AAGD07_19295 [Planctomycetota bacterium]
MSGGRERFGVTAWLTWASFVIVTNPAHSQSAGPTEDAAVPAPEEAGLADLVSRGRITWHLGGRRPYTSRLLYERPAGGDGSRERVFDAETRFEMSYKYESRCPWRWHQDVLEIRPHFFNVRWNVTHQVWLKRPPSPERFWQSALVLHEMDHVRTSSHPAYAALFRRDLEQITLLRFDRAAIRRVLGGGVFDRTQRPRLSGDQIRQLIKPSTMAAFDRVVDLAEIRYRELDRLTDHGLIALPLHWHEQQEAALEGIANATGTSDNQMGAGRP